MPSLFTRRALQREFVTIGLAIAVVVSARTSLADHYVVPTGSMIPTVEPDDHVLVDKLAYGLRLPFLESYVLHFTPPARGDVVVLSSPDDGTVLLKRVVGVPGDRIAVMDGGLVIDGRPVPVLQRGGASIERLGAAEHAISFASGGGPDYGPVAVPVGKYLVMGDNRGNSRDGRTFGFVSRDAILGRVAGVIARAGKPTWVGLD
jgi:signal peptidase I